MKVDGARVDIGNAALDILICDAYRVKTYQVVVPIALNKVRFDILAKIPEGASKEQVPEMLQSLLAARFKLVFHRENREIAIYALVVAKGGPKLKESAGEPDTAEAKSGRLPDGSAIAHTAGGDQVRLASGKDGVLRVESSRMKIAGLADMIRRFVDRPIVDMTDLNGEFQIAFDTSLGVERSAATANSIPSRPRVRSGTGFGLRVDPKARAAPRSAEGAGGNDCRGRCRYDSQRGLRERRPKRLCDVP